LNKTIYIKCLVLFNLRKIPNLSKIVLYILLVFLTSCNVTQFLEKDQYIVAKNNINIKDIDSRSVRNGLKAELSTLYKQKQLNSFFIFKSKSGAWYYYKGVKNPTAPKFKRFLYRSFGKRPTLFDTSQTNLTVRSMKQYLINKGYLYPSVFYEKDFYSNEHNLDDEIYLDSDSINMSSNKDKGFTDVTYYVNPGKLYVLDTVNIRCVDTTIQYLLNDTKEESFLQHGTPLSSSLYEKERIRITTLLKNNGYARFTPNFISQIYADTLDTGLDIKGNRKANATLTIQLPNDKPTHQKFYVGDVKIFPNYDARYELPTRMDTFYNGKFYYSNNKPSIKVSTLDNVLSITPNTLYSSKIESDIQRRIGVLGYYKFVNINANIEECDSTILQYNILLTPDKKMSFETGAEINYSNISSQNANSFGRMGVALDLQFTNRNFLGGAERFSSTLSGGVDFGFLSSNNDNNGLSSDIRFDNVLSLPKFINPTRTFKRMNKWNIISDNFYNEIKDNTTTDINLSYTYSDRLALKLYSLNQFNLGYKYVLKRRNGLERIVFSPTGVELILSNLNKTFEDNANPRTIRSLDNQLLTGFFFRNMSYEKTIPSQKIGGVNLQYLVSLEQSGSEIWLAEKVFGQKDNPWKLSNGLKFSKFWKAEFEIRMNDQVETNFSKGFGARMAVGLATNFGDALYVPYSRQFFVGGPNSIRGWQARGLGPGSSNDTTFRNTLPFQTGDIKLEFNSEYRFPIWWIFKSAIFLDAGNIWALKSTDPDANIGKFWYDQIAISSGVGIRVDVKYALIRLDLGFKLRNPYQDENKRNWIPVNDYTWKNNVNLNFALGLPF
jgi:outer membrane protein insertion porin family